MLPGTEIVVGDLEDPGSLAEAVRDVNAVIFVHGSEGDERADAAERIDYGGVVNVMSALGDRRPRTVLQTTYFITHREHHFNDGPQHALDWKRRSERIVRLSGAPYTIMRPGWLDRGSGGAHVTIEQGDTIEGSISREVLSSMLVEALLSAEAVGKTFEVFSGPGQATPDWNGLFARAERDQPGALDAVKDAANMPLDAEPSTVQRTTL